MATFTRRSDPMVSCPYNQAHRMLKSRLQMHLVKCKKDNATVEKQVCPFNAQHLCDRDTFVVHLGICPDRCIIDRQLVQSKLEESEFRGAANVPSYHSSIQGFSEVWELNDRPVAGYEPEKHLSNKDYLVRDLAHFKPAEKRKYYKDCFLQSNSDPSEEESNLLVKSSPSSKPKEPERVCLEPKNEPQLLRNVPFSVKPPRDRRGQFEGDLAKSRIAANFSMPNRENNVRTLTADLSNLSLGIGRGGIAASKRTDSHA